MDITLLIVLVVLHVRLEFKLYRAQKELDGLRAMRREHTTLLARHDRLLEERDRLLQELARSHPLTLGPIATTAPRWIARPPRGAATT